jgi:Cu/Ag efflux pump CusA
VFVAKCLACSLCSYLLKGGAEHDTKVVSKLKTPYMKWLNWCLENPSLVVKRALIALGVSLFGFVLLGKSFIPVMQEGSITPVIVRAPNISLEESIKLEFEALKRIMTIDGVEKVVSKLGRGESPADPGQPNESDPIVTLKPQDLSADSNLYFCLSNLSRSSLTFFACSNFSNSITYTVCSILTLIQFCSILFKCR